MQYFSEAPGYTELDRELANLFHTRRQIDARIRELLGSDLDKPIWGPCTRCGYIWTGKWANRRPRHCARCHSAGWDTAPTRAPKPSRFDKSNKRLMQERLAPPSNVTTMPSSALEPPPRLFDVVPLVAPVAFPMSRLDPPQPERSLTYSDVTSGTSTPDLVIAVSDEAKQMVRDTVAVVEESAPVVDSPVAALLPVATDEWLAEAERLEQEDADGA
jgi:hypothetical protein